VTYQPLEVLVAATDARPPEDPAERFYGSSVELRGMAGSRLLANFVTTIDGVVSLGGDDSGVTVSGGSAEDRAVMALLRSEADVVLLGAGTLRSMPRHRWTPAHLEPDSAELWRAHRRRVGAPGSGATLIVVSAHGEIPLDHPAISHPDGDVVILTTNAGAPRAEASGARVVVLSDAPWLRGASIRQWIDDTLAPSVILCEGGPRLLGSLFEDGVADELFLTIAPRIAGRVDDSRNPLVLGWAAPASLMPRATLQSLRRAGDLLFARYRINDP